MTALLEARLCAGYGKTRILEDVSFNLAHGDALGLVGTSGAGKSTLVMALLGLLPWRGGYASGQVLLEGSDLLTLPEREVRSIRGRRIALVPQSPMTALNSAISLRAHFTEAWRAHEPPNGKAFEARLVELMSQMQLPPEKAFLARRPSEISVGQAQRILIALALLHRPALLVADEPTSALDPVTQAEIVALLRRLRRESGISLLYISHDLMSTLQLCDRLAVLDRGRLVECLDVGSLDSLAQHPATLRLLQALPVPASIIRGYQQTSAGMD